MSIFSSCTSGLSCSARILSSWEGSSDPVGTTIEASTKWLLDIGSVCSVLPGSFIWQIRDTTILSRPFRYKYPWKKNLVTKNTPIKKLHFRKTLFKNSNSALNPSSVKKDVTFSEHPTVTWFRSRHALFPASTVPTY